MTSSSASPITDILPLRCDRRLQKTREVVKVDVVDMDALQMPERHTDLIQLCGCEVRLLCLHRLEPFDFEIAQRSTRREDAQIYPIARRDLKAEMGQRRMRSQLRQHHVDTCTTSELDVSVGAEVEPQ